MDCGTHSLSGLLGMSTSYCYMCVWHGEAVDGRKKGWGGGNGILQLKITQMRLTTHFGMLNICGMLNMCVRICCICSQPSSSV